MDNEDNDFTHPSDDEGTAATDPAGAPADRRPVGFWLRTVDGLITREFATAFADAGIDRRDWMILNVLSGDLERPGFAERFGGKGFAGKGRRLRGLAERGWVEEQGDGTWALTDEGRAARERIGEIVDGIRSRVSGAVSPEDYATTTASLAAIARELGWEEGQRMPRGGFGRGFGRGFGPGFRPGFGPEQSDERGEDDGPRGAHHCHPHAHGGHPHGARGGRGHGDRSAQRAYERGFDAGFSRGRSADVA